MAATPAPPKPLLREDGKTGFGPKALNLLKNVGQRLAGYAITKFREDPALVISGLTRVVNGAAAKLPPKLVGPAQTVIAATSAVAIKSTVTPAVPDAKTSPLQAAAERAQRSLRT